MGCGCQGSLTRQDQQAAGPRERVAQSQQRRRRSGGPGEPGYAWTGPVKPKADPK